MINEINPIIPKLTKIGLKTNGEAIIVLMKDYIKQAYIFFP